MIREIKKDMGDALKSLVPSAKYIIRNNIKEKTYNLEWIDEEITEPTKSEIDAEVIRLQAEYDALAYARSRKAEYDALNQFELISDDDVNGTTTHKDAIAAIKAKYPKE